MQIINVPIEASAISRDMRDLYESFKSGETTREGADTLANISGKNLKAISIVLADQLRLDALGVGLPPGVRLVEQTSAVALERGLS